MKNQNFLFIDLSQAFSQSRLSAYLQHAECKDSLDALAAYYWNIQLSESLYAALQALEVTLRNALHRSLIEDCGTENWFDSFILRDIEKRSIIELKNKLVRKNKPTDADRVISTLPFGFWTSLFDSRYEYNQILWPRLLHSVFPFIPKSLRNRPYLSRQLNRIRSLRNRIFHYEPIWHWTDLAQQHKNILDLVQWISPTAYQHVVLLDRFQKIHLQGFSKNRDLLADTFLSKTSTHIHKQVETTT